MPPELPRANDFDAQLNCSDRPFLMDVGNGSTTLMVAFSGISGGFGIYPFEFFNITRQFNVDKIFVKDQTKSWFQQGVHGMTASLEETAQLLRKLIDQHRYEKVVFLGNSMGGYAAIALGVLAGADEVLAFAPQTFLDPDNRSHHRDNRWPQEIGALPPQSDPRFLDLKRLLDGSAFEGIVRLYYASDERIDAAHARHIESCRGVELSAYPEGGHLLVQHMKKSGELYRVLRNTFARSGEDRLLSVWKELASGDRATALSRHRVDPTEFSAYQERHDSLANAQQALLMRFFAAVDRHIPAHFSLACVNVGIAPQQRHNAAFCKDWFDGRKKQFFGSFFALNDPHRLLHIEVGTQNLHVGIVKCRRTESGGYAIVAMQEDDFAATLALYGDGLPAKLKLLPRNWGHRWCSIDCGRFDSPEMYGNYQAMADFAHSNLLGDVIAPFIEHIRAAGPAVPQST